jgi:hypothetical protein
MPAIGASVSWAADAVREAADPFTLGARAAVEPVADFIAASIAVLSSAVAGRRVKGWPSIGTTLMIRMEERVFSLGMICEDIQLDMKTHRRTPRIKRFISTPLTQFVDISDMG